MIVNGGHFGVATRGAASRAMVRVCFVIDRLRAAGTENQLLTLISGLGATGVAPFLVLLDGQDDHSMKLEPTNCPVLRLGVRALKRPASALAAWRLYRFFRENRIDVVQMHFPDSTYFAAPVARLAGVRHIVKTRRDLGYWMTGRDRWLGRLYSRICTVALANCQACSEALVEQEGSPSGGVHVLPNGVDTNRFDRLAITGHRSEARPWRVGMIANIRAIKAPEVLAAAALRLQQQGRDVSFAIAGDDHEGHIERLCSDLGLERPITLCGSTSAVEEFLAGLDVAVLCSHSEGLSNAILEYMAAGRPIVATQVGAIGELIENSVHGLLVPPAEPEALAQAIGRLIDDRQLAVRLGKAARERVQQLFSLEAMVSGHAGFYRRIANREASGDESVIYASRKSGRQ